jgi:hypothetical protein
MKLALTCLAMTALSCVGTTGGDLVTFTAVAAGPADAVEGAPLDFTTDRGWNVRLTVATLHIGAMYLNQALPVSGAQNTSCILPGTYVAQVTTGADVNLLSPAPQPFPRPGTGVTIPALAGQLWLTGVEINTVADTTPILHIEGTAEKSGAAFPFAGTLTIGANRLPSNSGAATAGGNPICKQRIVSPIAANLEPRSTGRLSLRVDPRALFANIDFVAPSSGTYVFPDDSSDQPGRNLYQNLHSSAPYDFEWTP